MVKKYVLVDKDTQKILNFIVWDGLTVLDLPPQVEVKVWDISVNINEFSPNQFISEPLQAG